MSDFCIVASKNEELIETFIRRKEKNVCQEKTKFARSQNSTMQP